MNVAWRASETANAHVEAQLVPEHCPYGTIHEDFFVYLTCFRPNCSLLGSFGFSRFSKTARSLMG